MSRLINNSEELRNVLDSKNLYNKFNEYKAENINSIQKGVNVANGIAGVLKPFSSFDITNTLAGRLFLPNTPIQQIGNVMLAKQFFNTTASNAATEFLPSINLKGIVSKKTKFFETKVDFQITRNDGGFLTKLGNFVNRLSGNYPLRSPFNEYSTNEDYVKNSGKGQLLSLNINLGYNLYQPTDRAFTQAMADKGYPIQISKDKLFRNWLPTDNAYFPDAYWSNIEYRGDIYDKYQKIDEDKHLEYYNKKSFVDDFGYTKPEKTQEIKTSSYGFENDKDSMNWGFLTSNNRYENFNESLFNSKTDTDKFNVKYGLLRYTKALMNASEGKLINNARKQFYDPQDNSRFIGYNGSGLYEKSINATEANEHVYDGMRQHNFADQYNRNVKAIRYNGNIIYEGNPNSVVYDSVIPKIHPVLNDDNYVDNTNMMFSIENLAVNVIPDKELGVAYIDDDYATEVPISECGELGGRVMWFPPYDIRFTETAIAKHETTTFIGRSEPIYTYNNSERIGSLSFKLLMDYPPNLLEYDRNSEDFHKNVSEFFAFGGEKSNYFGTLSKLKKELLLLLEETEVDQEPPEEANVSIPSSYSMFFPNDSYSTDDILAKQYSVGGGGSSFPESGNLNDTAMDLQFLSELENFFIDNEDVLGNFKIKLTGKASKIYNGTEEKANSYNQDLSEKRISAVKSFINELFSQSKKCQYSEVPLGDVESKEPYSNTDVENFKSQEAAQERLVNIEIEFNESDSSKEGREDERIGSLEWKIAEKRKEIALLKTGVFKRDTIEDTTKLGFQSVREDKFSSIFHSITPEEFHRRLTFLQQCVRQGKGIKSNSGLAANNPAFGKQPVQVLRIGDFFNTKIIIDNIDFDYTDTMWDMNPEGMGMQPMIVDISIQMRIIGGQSLQTPISIIQNATSFNYYANSTFYDANTYSTPSGIEKLQVAENDKRSTTISNKGVKDILDEKGIANNLKNELEKNSQ